MVCTGTGMGCKGEIQVQHPLAYAVPGKSQALNLKPHVYQPMNWQSSPELAPEHLAAAACCAAH